MLKELELIHLYILTHNISEYSIEERCNHITHSITVNWVENDIRCQCNIYSEDNVDLKMLDQWNVTKGILIANFKK